MGNENKEKSPRDVSDSKKSHSNSSNEEAEIVNEGDIPSDDDQKSSSSESSDSYKSSEDESEKKRKDRRRKRTDSPENSPESNHSENEGDDNANSTLPGNSYLDVSNTDSSKELATQADIDTVNTHIENVLESNKRFEHLLELLTDLFDKGYWRSELQRNKSFLERLFISNHVTVAEMKWCNNTFLRMIDHSQQRAQSSNSQSTISGIREIKPLLVYPPSKAQIDTIEHELDQPGNRLNNREIMSKQFADRLEIRLGRSLQSDNPLELEAGKVQRLFSHNCYTPKEVMAFLKQFFLNHKKERVTNLTPTQLMNDLTGTFKNRPKMTQ
jgi:hypothetical protein